MEYIATRWMMPPETNSEEMEAAWKEAEDLVEVKTYIKRKCKEDGRRIVYYVPVEPLERYIPPKVEEKEKKRGLRRLIEIYDDYRKSIKRCEEISQK